MKGRLKVFTLLAGLFTCAVLAHAVTIQSFKGTGANSTVVEHTWDDSGNYTANGTITAAGVTNTGNGTITGTLTVTGASALNGTVTLSTTTVSANNTFYIGTGASVSTFTATTAQFGGPVTLYSRTKAQLQALVPGSAGQIIYCSNCAATPVVVSTGTGAGAWVSVSSPTAYGALQ